MRLKVTPNAAQRSVHGVFAEGHGAVLKVGVTAAPEGGKANTAVVNLLAWEWRLPRSRFHVTAGAAIRGKTVLVEGDPATLLAQLNQWMDRNHA